MRQGWNGQLEVAVTPFTVEQRRRLEALTAARMIRECGSVDDWLRLARYIEGVL